VCCSATLHPNPSPEQGRLLDAGRVEHVGQVERVLVDRVRPRPRRPAVAAQVVGDDAPVPVAHPRQPLEAAGMPAGAVQADERRQIAGPPLQDPEPAHDAGV
jgi:hypothetical protein